MTLNYTDEHALQNIDKSLTSILESLKPVSIETKKKLTMRGEIGKHALYSMQEEIQKILNEHKRNLEGVKISENLLVWKNSDGEYEIWDTRLNCRLVVFIPDTLVALMNYWGKMLQQAFTKV